MSLLLLLSSNVVQIRYIMITPITHQASVFFSKSGDDLEWRRPGELAGEPRLMEGGADR